MPQIFSSEKDVQRRDVVAVYVIKVLEALKSHLKEGDCSFGTEDFGLEFHIYLDFLIDKQIILGWSGPIFKCLARSFRC